jgi:mRNA interferase YafQ
MLTIDWTNQFKRDYTRESRGRYGRTLDQDLAAAMQYLLIDERLPDKFRDHALTGDWRDHRDCHLRPDLVLIYRKPDPLVLQLVRLGSHSELEL